MNRASSNLESPTMEAAFLQAILDNPAGEDTWPVLTDWLEESGQPERAELVRLHVRLRGPLPARERRSLEKRAQKLLDDGALPCVPTVTNSLGMKLTLVSPGRFTMGTPSGSSPEADEHPPHQVTISRPFFLGTHQVTQAQFVRIMHRNPSHFTPDGGGAPLVQHLDTGSLPVDSVSYEDIEEFCYRLSRRAAERRAGRVYRLPTEAEWEYACRAGVSHTPYHFGRSLRARFARFNGQGGAHPLPVGSHRPNLFGLYDMHGNVWEWCADWYDDRYYTRAPERDPPGPAEGQRRVLRGGGWCSSPNLCRSALRGHNTVDARHNYNGFRIALSVPGT
jgi:uncharacterized protein (TIGR02996 family)